MERVAFLIEHTGERISCLLNPETVAVRRVAGVRARRSLNGVLTGAGLADDRLLYTGGGSTELELDLLFDVSLAGASIENWRKARPNEGPADASAAAGRVPPVPEVSVDVRDLTAPLWELAENSERDEGYGRPPLVRFVWGKSWNVPGIVSAVSEKLEHFTPGGAPRRSWLRMRLVRVEEPDSETAPGTFGSRQREIPEIQHDIPPDAIRTHEIIGGGGAEHETQPSSGERLDEIAHRYYGDPALWRLIAAFNKLSDPLRLSAGAKLDIPPLSALSNPK